jgi:hypothetical protein
MYTLVSFQALQPRKHVLLLLKNKDQSASEQCASHAASNCMKYLTYQPIALVLTYGFALSLL